MSNKKNLVVFTGAGMSAESGLQTFRGHGGLWEGHRVQDVATPEAWNTNPELVLQFYNERRSQLLNAKPNRGHELIAELEDNFHVNVITQNVDDLHERANSTSILHLHGELKKARSTGTGKIYPLKRSNLNIGDTCPDGWQLRPHIVWFGEEVPELLNAIEIVKRCDIFMVIGSSLQVYPAASLIDYTPDHSRRILIDPNPAVSRNIEVIAETASVGLLTFISKLKK